MEERVSVLPVTWKQTVFGVLGIWYKIALCPKKKWFDELTTSSLLVWYIKCRRTYERPLVLPLRCEQHGKILRHSRVTNGFAGLRTAKKRRRDVSVSRRHSRSLKAECAGLVVGSVALIVERAVPNVFQSLKWLNLVIFTLKRARGSPWEIISETYREIRTSKKCYCARIHLLSSQCSSALHVNPFAEKFP